MSGALALAALLQAAGPAARAADASVVALMQQARRQSGRKDAAGALATLGRALELAPNSEEVLHARAQVALAARAPLVAAQHLEPLTRLCPGVAQYHYLLGVALLQAGAAGFAIEPLRRAEQLEPNRALTLAALGLALNNRKLYAEARPLLLRSLELEPDNTESVAALAEAHEGLGELAEAEQLAQRALARDGGHGAAHLVLGMVRMRQERYAEARDAFERAVAAAPEAPKPHYQLSLAYARLGDEARAQQHVEAYRRALKDLETRAQQTLAALGLSAAGMGS